ncbi:endoglucanase IV [Phaeosphaeriaceae sp. PMI808]|nr:endoglucanase IV [Phaeosphaeriaceae sp. PMI808]
MWYVLLALVLQVMPVVLAHGRITQITTSTGTVYPGWNPEFALTPPVPSLVAWRASNLGNIYVPPSRFNTTDITCHFDATPGALHVNTTAGDTLKLQWNEWPVSHVGPVLNYLAACNGSCFDAKKENLKWIKIEEMGWLNETGWDSLMLGGTWATNILISNNYQWTVRIPQSLAGGNYVLRHEIIALHVAEELNGAQAYPQCVNLRVKRAKFQKEKKLVGGDLGTNLYGLRDNGILVNVHSNIKGYKIPGPRVWRGATPVKQPNQ